MFDGTQLILTEDEIIDRAYRAMEECMTSLRNGSKKYAARSRGEAAMWEFTIYFNFGREDESWKSARWYEMEQAADAANL